MIGGIKGGAMCENSIAGEGADNGRGDKRQRNTYALGVETLLHRVC